MDRPPAGWPFILIGLVLLVLMYHYSAGFTQSEPVRCPMCSGEGVILDTNHESSTFGEWVTCPECGGSGITMVSVPVSSAFRFFVCSLAAGFIAFMTYLAVCKIRGTRASPFAI